MTEKFHSLLCRIESIEKKLNQNDRDHKEFYNRIRGAEMHEAIQDQRYNTITEKLDMAIKTIEAIKDAPGKKWESMMDKIFFAVLGSVIAFLLSKLGL